MASALPYATGAARLARPTPPSHFVAGPFGRFLSSSRGLGPLSSPRRGDRLFSVGAGAAPAQCTPCLGPKGRRSPLRAHAPPRLCVRDIATASGASMGYSEEEEQEAIRRAQASKRVERTAKYFRSLGFLGFWGQLACTLVAAVILTFSIVITGKPTAPVSTYLTAGGIVAAFLSIFTAFSYLRLADRLRAAVDNPSKAPPRASVVASLKNGLIVNLIGLAATLLGLQATVGTLVAKALTSTAPMYGAMGTPAGYNPVLALDVFLVQACGNTALSHFLGLLLSLELLRATTQSQPPPDVVIPKLSS